MLAKSSRNVPDLISAGLTLVSDSAEREQARVLHYAGLNGCRLTLAITTGDLPQIKADLDLRMASWSIAADHFTLLSSGMDAARFAAISHHIRLFTEELNRPAAVLAMRETTKNAVPCV